MRPAPLPLHLLRGDHALLDGLLEVGRWGSLVVRLAAGPVALLSGGPWLGVVGLGALWFGLSRRRVRSSAAPIGEEALFVTGCGALAAWGLGTPWALLLGLAAGPVVLGLLLGAVWLLWGRTPTPVQMRTPWFRVLGDNPATVTFVTKVRVTDRLVLELDQGADGPVNAVLYGLDLRPVARVSWDRIEAAYRQGQARVVLDAPPGRYLLSTRFYRPWDALVPPRVAA